MGMTAPMTQVPLAPDLLGRKLDKKPTEKGVYIHNNKKKVIK